LTRHSTNSPTGKSPEPVLLSAPSVFRMNASCEAPIRIQDAGWVELLRWRHFVSVAFEPSSRPHLRTSHHLGSPVIDKGGQP
jgi:hypothetical protein